MHLLESGGVPVGGGRIASYSKVKKDQELDPHGTEYERLNAELIAWLRDPTPGTGGGSRYGDILDDVGENCRKFLVTKKHELASNAAAQSRLNRCFRRKSKALAEFFATRISMSSDHYVGRIIFAVGPMIASSFKEVVGKEEDVVIRSSPMIGGNKASKAGVTVKNKEDARGGTTRIITHAELRKLYRLWLDGDERFRDFLNNRVHWFWQYGLCGPANRTLRTQFSPDSTDAVPCTHDEDCPVSNPLVARCWSVVQNGKLIKTKSVYSPPEWTEDTAPWQAPRTSVGRLARTQNYQDWEKYIPRRSDEARVLAESSQCEDVDIFSSHGAGCRRVRTIFDDAWIGAIGIEFESEKNARNRPVLKSLQNRSLDSMRTGQDCEFRLDNISKTSATSHCVGLARREYGRLLRPMCELVEMRVGDPPRDIVLASDEMPLSVFKFMQRGDFCNVIDGMRDLGELKDTREVADILRTPPRADMPRYRESVTRQGIENFRSTMCKARTVIWECPES
jgi:hypothetical protein